jgi:hypothetical protein
MIKENIMGGIIYKATLTQGSSPGKKCYIGQTTKSLEKRRHAHEKNAENGLQTYFYAALRKYGKDAFMWEILDRTDSVDQLGMLEKKYIALFKSNIKGFGYNLTEGGEGFVNPSESSRKKLSTTKKTQFAGPRGDDLREKCRQAALSFSPTEDEAKRRDEGVRAFWASPEGKAKAIELGEQRLGYKYSKESKKRISEQKLTFLATPEGQAYVETYSKQSLGLKRSDETRQRLRDAWVIRKNAISYESDTERSGKKISAALKDKPKSEAHRQATSDALAGKPKSEAHKQALRDAWARRRADKEAMAAFSKKESKAHQGKKQSIETIEKRMETQRRNRS